MVQERERDGGASGSGCGMRGGAKMERDVRDGSA